jgi:hypothetical protein
LADAWGGSWGLSWDGSWGAADVVQPPVQEVNAGTIVGRGRPRPPRPEPFDGLAHGALIIVRVSFEPGQVSAGANVPGAGLPIDLEFLPGNVGGVEIIPGKAAGQFFGLSPEELFLLLEAA